MAVEGCDYAFSSPDPQLLFAAGKRFAMRYVGPGSDSKHLHAAERDQIWAAGLSIVLLAEGTADGALGGSAVGRSHATTASTAAQWLGAPNWLPIYFAVDFDVTTAQWPAVANYLRGAASVIGVGRVGIYGGIRAMQWAARDGVAKWFFQTYAWSAGQWYGGNHVEQYDNDVQLAGGTVDLCRAVTVNYGQWGPNQEDDMANIDQQDWDALIYRVEALINNRDTVVGSVAAGQPNLLAAKLAELEAKLDALPGGTPAAGPVDLTDAAVAKVADAVVDEEHNRLAQ